MNNNKLTKKIMLKVSYEEENRVKRFLLAISFLFLSSLLILTFSFYHIIAGFVSKGTFELISTLESDWEIFTLQLPVIALFFWEDLEKELAIALLLSIIALIFLIRKIISFSPSRRLQEIHRYQK
jgi:hypothetical protein